MDTPTTRQDLANRNRLATRTEYMWLALAVTPALLFFVLPDILGREELFPNLSKTTKMWLAFGGLAWIFGIIFGPYRWTARKLGLRCSRCGHRFVLMSFEVLITTGRCGGCGERILTDERDVTPNTSLERTRGR